jgi:hypothetical protein
MRARESERWYSVSPYMPGLPSPFIPFIPFITKKVNVC